MNKIFIAILTFCFAIAAVSGQPSPNEICETNTKIVLNMANLVERVAKGEGIIIIFFVAQIIYLLEGRSLSIYLYFCTYLADALSEHFLQGSAQLRIW